MLRSARLPFARWSAVCCTLVFVCACAATAPPLSPTPASAVQPRPVESTPLPSRVAVADLGLVTQAPVYVAMDRGYFAAESLEVTLVPARSTSDAALLLTSGQVDFGASAPDPALFNAMERGVEIRLLGSGGVFWPGTAASGIVVRQDLLDQQLHRSPADLKGRKIAVAAVQSQFYVEQILGQAGLTAADVEFTTLPLPEISAALKNHAVDAAWMVEPLISAARAQGVGTLTVTGFEAMPGGVSWLVLSSPRATGGKSEVAVRFMRAYLRGMRDFYHAFGLKDEGSAAVLDALAAHSSVKDRRVLETVAMHTVDPNGAIDIASLDRYQDYYVATGNQKHKLDLTQYLDPAPLEAALGTLGRL